MSLSVSCEYAISEPSTSDDDLLFLEEPSPVTYYGDDSIIDRAIARHRAGVGGRTIEELDVAMRTIIDRAKRGY